MRDVADAGRLFESGKISEDICIACLLGALVVTSIFVLVFQCAGPADNRLAEFTSCSKDNGASRGRENDNRALTVYRARALLPHIRRCYDDFYMASNMGSKPRIGVPYRTKKEQAIGDRSKIHHYLKAVQIAGGDPIPIPLDLSDGELQRVAETLDGIALSGSPADVDPALFKSLPHAKTAAPDYDRERTDFGLLEHFFAEGKPVLAICYGIQSLNVFLGGTLVQDIPSEIGWHIEHDVQGDHSSPETFHKIRIEPGSRIAGLANALKEVRVNSSHHQSVRDVGRGLHVTAVCSDGVIEALEGNTSGHWVTAVQWHPERMVEMDAFALSLFRDLIAAARKVPTRA